jgi:hypothetical protein
MKDRRFSCLVFSANRKKERERKKKEAPGENPLEVFLSCVLLCE